MLSRPSTNQTSNVFFFKLQNWWTKMLYVNGWFLKLGFDLNSKTTDEVYLLYLLYCAMINKNNVFLFNSLSSPTLGRWRLRIARCKLKSNGIVYLFIAPWDCSGTTDGVNLSLSKYSGRCRSSTGVQWALKNYFFTWVELAKGIGQ